MPAATSSTPTATSGGSGTGTTGVATPVATPSPTLVAGPVKPDLASLVATVDGLGPLVVNSRPPAGDPATDVVVFDPEFCPSDYAEVGPRGVWVTNYPDEPIAKFSGPELVQQGRPFEISTDDMDAIRWIEIRSSRILTDAGIHTGSTRQEVIAAYPDADVTEWGSRGAIIAVAGGQGRLVFEVAGPSANASIVDTVYMIRVERLDGTPAPYQGTDKGIHPCSRA